MEGLGKKRKVYIWLYPCCLLTEFSSIFSYNMLKFAYPNVGTWAQMAKSLVVRARTETEIRGHGGTTGQTAFTFGEHGETRDH